MKKYAGAILVAVAGLVAWWWWKRRQTGATLSPDGSVTVPPNQDTSTLPNLQQVGSNVYQDVSESLIDKILASYERVIGGCWTFTGRCWGTPRNCEYRNSVSGLVTLFPEGTPPLPLCGGAGAAAP